MLLLIKNKKSDKLLKAFTNYTKIAKQNVIAHTQTKVEACKGLLMNFHLQRLSTAEFTTPEFGELTLSHIPERSGAMGGKGIPSVLKD